MCQKIWPTWITIFQWSTCCHVYISTNFSMCAKRYGRDRSLYSKTSTTTMFTIQLLPLRTVNAVIKNTCTWSTYCRLLHLLIISSDRRHTDRKHCSENCLRCYFTHWWREANKNHIQKWRDSNRLSFSACVPEDMADMDHYIPKQAQQQGYPYN